MFSSIRDENKDDLDKVAALVLSHLRAQSKSKLVFALLDEVKNGGVNLANPDIKLHKVLQGLASLDAKFVDHFLLFTKTSDCMPQIVCCRVSEGPRSTHRWPNAVI